jgi:ribA/ribD-fused uncharacterized protein
MEKPIYFCEPEYYPLSNFSAFTLLWKGRLWPTSEHAYQAEKFSSEEVLQKLQSARSVDEAYEIAQKHASERRPDWEEVKMDIMKQLFIAKTAQHPKIKRLLLESGERELIKDSPLDNFWGWGPGKNGKNMMGKLWMEVRDEIRKNEAS